MCRAVASLIWRTSAVSSLEWLPRQSLKGCNALPVGKPSMSPNTEGASAAISGLTAQEAQARLDKFGPNEPAATQQHSIFSDLLHEFSNPLVLILIIAAVASAFLGEKTDAAIIGIIVLLSAAIDLTQTYR